jgi:hypothetical protein
MNRKTTPKIAVVILGGAVFLAAVMPLGLYWLGLSNIEGRPEPPGNIRDVAADRALLQQDLRMHGPIEVQVLDPWRVLVSIFRIDEHARSNRAVGIVATNYNSDHIKYHGMMWWHLSEMSLMIWLTRHWTADEIITAAAAHAQSHPNPSPPP